MQINLRRKLYPLFAGFFALSLVLGACGGGSDEVIDEPAIEEPALDEGIDEGVEEGAGVEEGVEEGD